MERYEAFGLLNKSKKQSFPRGFATRHSVEVGHKGRFAFFYTPNLTLFPLFHI